MPTTAVAPEGERYPQMRRPLPTGHQPPARPRNRRCRPRDIPTHKTARDRYHRLVAMRGPTEPAALAVLLVLLDRAGGYLNEVEASQEQIGQLLRARHPQAPLWGTGTSTVRRATRHLEDSGWLSVADVPIPGREGLHMLRYRFHVPAHAVGEWERICENSENARRRGLADQRAKAAAASPPRPAQAGSSQTEPVEPADDPDERHDPELVEACTVVRQLHHDRTPLADILAVLKCKWAPGTRPYEEAAQTARALHASAERRAARRGARDGP